MKKYHFYLGTGFTGATHEEEFEFDDNVSEEEVEETYEDWKNNILECGWWEVKE